MSVRPFHHQRPLAAAAAAWGLGIGAGAAFAWRPLAYAVGLLGALGLTALLPHAGRKRIAGILCVFLFLGMLRGGYAAHPALPEEGRYQAEGVAARDIKKREDGTAAGYLENVILENEQGTQRVSRVYWTYTPKEGDDLPQEGDRVRFEGTAYHPSGRENPYGFDFRMYLLQKGAMIGISGGRDLDILWHEGRGLRSLTYQARKWISERIDLIFGDGAALPKALLIGERSELPRDTVQSFRDAGAAHVLAVSGLHVALLAGLWMRLLRRWMKPKGRLAVLAALLFLYCALLDFSAPVVRASLLLMLVHARVLVFRSGDRLTALSFAFLLILLFRPLDLFSAGFQLSFCAVLGIILLLPWLEKRLPGALRQSVGVTLSATAGAAIPTAQAFHRLSLAGVLVNPLVCGAFALLLPAYFLATAAGCLWIEAGRFAARYLNVISGLLTEGIRVVGALPFATVNVPALPWYCVAALVLAAALATRYTVWAGKKKAIAAITALAVSFGIWQITECRDVQYVQLSLGQADSALILDGRQTVVIDAGEYGGDTADYLLATGRQADYLILTHLHLDHCGGLRQLMDDQVPIGAIYLPWGAEDMDVDEEALKLLDEARNRGIPVYHLSAGDEIRLSRTALTVTWPQGDRVRAGQDANRYALGLLCDLDGVTLLNCSDLTGDYELYAARDADILKVAHHGSKTSTGEEFLSLVSPRAAIVSASDYSGILPHPETLERLYDCGASVYVTGRTGAVTVRIHEGEAWIDTFLKERP